LSLYRAIPPELQPVHEGLDIDFVFLCATLLTQLLRVTRADQAMSLLLSSERVFRDLNTDLTCLEAWKQQHVQISGDEDSEPAQKKGQKEEEKDNEKTDQGPVVAPWSTQLIMRVWDDDIDDSNEFRCFVHQSKLTAISQYNHYCQFKHLVNLPKVRVCFVSSS
jgi:hypothetical protein